jgi:glycine reductase
VRYSVAGLDDLTPEAWECIHGGFDTHEANRDPDRVVPLDAARALESDGLLGTLHDDYFATVGVGTSVETAARFGREIAAELRGARVEGALMVAT